MQNGGEVLPVVKLRNNGRAARQKGHSFERWVANRLKPIDPTAQRNLEESRLGTYDIDLTIPFAIQCKCMRSPPNPHNVWHQANDGMRDQKRIPVACIKISYVNPVFIVMQESHFRDLFDNEIEERKVYWNVLRQSSTRGSGQYPKFYVETVDKAGVGEIPALAMRFARNSNSYRSLVFIDFEHWIKQVEFKYGKKENNSNELQR